MKLSVKVQDVCAQIENRSRRAGEACTAGRLGIIDKTPGLYFPRAVKGKGGQTVTSYVALGEGEGQERYGRGRGRNKKRMMSDWFSAVVMHC